MGGSLDLVDINTTGDRDSTLIRSIPPEAVVPRSVELTLVVYYYLTEDVIDREGDIPGFW